VTSALLGTEFHFQHTDFHYVIEFGIYIYVRDVMDRDWEVG